MGIRRFVNESKGIQDDVCIKTVYTALKMNKYKLNSKLYTSVFDEND